MQLWSITFEVKYILCKFVMLRLNFSFRQIELCKKSQMYQSSTLQNEIVYLLWPITTTSNINTYTRKLQDLKVN